jgi:hypothetical protein
MLSLLWIKVREYPEIERAIKKWQYGETGNIGYTRQRKTKHNLDGKKGEVFFVFKLKKNIIFVSLFHIERCYLPLFFFLAEGNLIIYILSYIL